MKFHILIPALILSLSTAATGQIQNFRQFGNEEGLYQTYIYSINQDSDGFLWIGTAEGLYKFDGFDFEFFTTEDGLSDNFIQKIFRDRSGKLWLGHQNGTLSIIEESGFTALNQQTENPGLVSDLTEDESGNIWVSILNQGLLFIDKEKKITTVNWSIHDEQVSQLEFLGNNYFLIGTQENLYLSKYDRESGEMLVMKRVDQYPGSKTVEIFPESGSDYIVVSQMDGFFRFTFDSPAAGFDLYAIDDNRDGALDNLQAGILDSDGAIWLTSMGKGIMKYVRDRNGDFFRETSFSAKNGLVSDNVRSIFEDLEGNIWFGMYGQGLINYSEKSLRIFNYNKENESKRIVAVTSYGNRLLQVTGSKLILLNRSGDTLINSYPLPVTSSVDRLNTLYVAPDSSIWLGFEKSGLYVSEPNKFRFRDFSISVGRLANSINHITGDNRYLWIGTKKGVCRINGENNELRWFTTEEGLPHNNIQQLYIDSLDRVLVATNCKEIFYIGSDGKVAILENSWIETPSLVTSFQESNDGTIWAGTMGNGVWELKKDGNINYTKISGLYSNFCYSLSLSDMGDLVIGHRGGISLIGPESVRIRVLSASEGIAGSIQFYPNAVLNDHSGAIWFGTSEGLVKFVTTPAKEASIPPKLSIEAVYVDGHKVDFRSGRIVLKPGHYEVEVEYIGLHLAHPGMVAYMTRLDGYNDDWSEPTADRKIIYARMEYGVYTFNIRAFNENDICSEITSAFELKIKEPFYISFWFFILIATLLGFILYLIIRIRERYHRKLQDKLLKSLDEKSREIIAKEEIIKERKRVEQILIEARMKAEASEKLKTSFLQNMSHEIRTPMNAILGFSHLLMDREWPVKRRKEFIHTISTSAESLLTLIDNILDLSKLETNQLKIEESNCRMIQLMTDLETTFLNRLREAGKAEIELRKVCPDDDNLRLITDCHRLKQILYNLLDNALKFTEKGEITFGCTVEETHIEFFVEDSGIGLTEEKAKVIFDLFRKIDDDQVKLYGGTGLGLTIVIHLVNLMGGEIYVESKPGIGSKFYFKLPRKE